MAEPRGEWQTREIPLGKGKEVFDAELTGACRALELARRIRGRGPVTVLIDSQAAINRLRHLGPGPGQYLAIQAHRAAEALTAQNRSISLAWVPGHEGVEGNERADQAAKRAATKVPRAGLGELSLAYTRRICTEAMKQTRQRWLTTALAKRSAAQQRTYRVRSGWQLDPATAKASKVVASRYYQLKAGHAAIGTHLHRIRRRGSATCRGCQAPRESVKHLLFECRQWRRPREVMYGTLRKEKLAIPTIHEEHPEGRLLAEPKATPAVLRFLQDTTVGCSSRELAQAIERSRRDDEWGLDALEEADREGEG